MEVEVERKQSNEEGQGEPREKSLSDVVEDYQKKTDMTEEDESWGDYCGNSYESWGQIGEILKFPSFEPSPIDTLRDVPNHLIPDMLFRMHNNYPLAVHARQHIRFLLKWRRKSEECKIYILAPGGNYKNGVVFFSWFQGHFNGSIYCHNKNEIKGLYKALTATTRVPLLNCTECRLNCMNYLSFKAIQPLLSSKDWCTSEDLILWLPWYCARALKVNLPEGVEIRELNTKYAYLVNEMWPDNYPGSVELVAEMIDTNLSMGVFRDDSLLSWALCWCHGGIGLIQTLENEKKKGYCRAVVEALTKKMGEQQIDVHLNITKARKRDMAFFKAIGFRYGFTSFCSETRKIKENEMEQIPLSAKKSDMYPKQIKK